MNERRPVQDRHERFIVDEFIRWWACHTREQFTVICRPDPPEAIVRSAQRTTWIEVTDAFFSGEWARDLYSLATPGEKHKPMEPGFHVDMDEHFAARFASLLKKKLSRDSYRATYESHGPGMLIVAMQSPWFRGETCSLMQEACARTNRSTDRDYFSQVFISFRSMGRQAFEEWHVRDAVSLVDL